MGACFGTVSPKSRWPVAPEVSSRQAAWCTSVCAVLQYLNHCLNRHPLDPSITSTPAHSRRHPRARSRRRGAHPPSLSPIPSISAAILFESPSSGLEVTITNHQGSQSSVKISSQPLSLFYCRSAPRLPSDRNWRSASAPRWSDNSSIGTLAAHNT